MNVQQVDPNTAVYKEFARLYRIAREIHPTSGDRWNGQLYAHNGGPWGSFNPKTGRMQLSSDLVLDHLTGSTTYPPSLAQAQALGTVLHETYHTRTDMDAPDNPNAVRNWDSVALNEGLIERQTVDDFELFADRAGYHELKLSTHQYEGVVEAADHLLRYAASPDRQAALRLEALNQPVAMQWEPIADEIVRNRLHDVALSDPQHQRAARTELINAMSTTGWEAVQYRPRKAGELLGRDTEASLDAALGRIREHYQLQPDQPFPATPPNSTAAALDAPQERAVTESTRLSGEDRHADAPRPALDPAIRAALDGQAPAAGATQRLPLLGDGSRRGSSTHGRPGRAIDSPFRRDER